MNRNKLALVFIVLIGLLLAGCSTSPQQIVQQVQESFPAVVGQPQITLTPFQPLAPTLTPTLTPTITPTPFKGMYIWLDPSLPPALIEQIKLPADWLKAASKQEANLTISAHQGGPDIQTTWAYALAAPFPTLTDDVSLDELQRAWRGDAGTIFTGAILVSPSTKAAFEAVWGPAGGSRVAVAADDELLEKAWGEHANGHETFAIIPFERIEPKWKILHVEGQSLFDRKLDLSKYPLAIWFGVTGDQEAIKRLDAYVKTGASLFPATNRDPEKMTVLAMTGVTALARATANKMDTLGMTYPARDIQDWLRDADLTHISNEVSFNPECPPGNPNSTSMMFCSRPEYIELLDFIGTDIVELSGNHNNDWGRKAFSYSLDLYHQRGWSIFAGGANIDEARTPAKITNHGNKLAFIGCNPAGPPGVWATSDEPGVADCGDYQWMLDEIRALRSEGFLPIVTFQYFEIYVPFPSDHQQRHFEEAVDAGAVVVQGSQAHFPQDMEFYKDGFVHFGLGNLFFDQMDIPLVGTRREFIDRHVFYDGKYISTELLTAMLEDYARPRPMTEDERQGFLQEIFKVAGW